MLMIRTPNENDFAFWQTLDPALPFDRFLRKIRDREGYVLFSEGVPAAVLRFELFLDRVPCCTCLKVSGEAPCAKEQLDTALLSWWEQDLLFRGYDRALACVPAEGAAAGIFRLSGYRETGETDLAFAGQGKRLFLGKELQEGCACSRKQEE